jgi:hypothetical protein
LTRVMLLILITRVKLVTGVSRISVRAERLCHSRVLLLSRHTLRRVHGSSTHLLVVLPRRSNSRSTGRLECSSRASELAGLRVVHDR